MHAPLGQRGAETGRRDARLNFAAVSNRPPMPMVLLMTNRPRLRSADLTRHCRASLTMLSTSERLPKKLCTPGADRRGKAAIVVRHRQKDRLIEARIEPIGEAVEALPGIVGGHRRRIGRRHGGSVPRRSAAPRPLPRPACRRSRRPLRTPAALSAAAAFIGGRIFRRHAADADALGGAAAQRATASKLNGTAHFIAPPAASARPACRACPPSARRSPRLPRWPP